MIQLPEGVEVHVGGQVYTGMIPTKMCPAELLPATTVPEPTIKPAGKADAKPA